MKNNLPDKQTNFLLYTGKDGKATISEHIKKIYEEEELELDSTVRKFRTVQTEAAISILEIVRKDAELKENSVCAYFAHTVA